MSAYEIVSLSDVPASGNWLPLRRHLGVGAFGINAWTATEAGADPAARPLLALLAGERGRSAEAVDDPDLAVRAVVIGCREPVDHLGG